MPAEHDLVRRQEWPPSPEHAGAARRFASDTLHACQDTAPVDEVNLVVSELATNAIVHAQTPFAVRVAWNGREVLIEVSDGSDRLPMMRPEGGCPGGRGLVIVDAMALQWGSTIRRTGKTVWAVLGGRAHDAPESWFAAGSRSDPVSRSPWSQPAAARWGA